MNELLFLFKFLKIYLKAVVSKKPIVNSPPGPQIEGIVKFHLFTCISAFWVVRQYCLACYMHFVVEVVLKEYFRNSWLVIF